VFSPKRSTKGATMIRRRCPHPHQPADEDEAACGA
jgi:hypothetical protein